MPVMDREPQNFLSYNAAYRVLICQKCQHAIQKNAIPSHLQRHKIYRKERQSLLSYISGLDLLDPEDVNYPPPGSPAIKHLPVTAGYCCIKPGCNTLYASDKRMKKHQSEDHGERELRDIGAFARRVQMQTFFQGTKHRYFEVTNALPDNHSAMQSFGAYLDSREGDNSHGIQYHSASPDHVSSRMSDRTPSQRTTSPAASIHSLAQASALNLEAMAYFRYYLAVTCLGLPAPYDEPKAWSTSVVDLALKHQWLMYGLLTLSAYNLAIASLEEENQDFDNARMHTREGNHFAAEFSKGFNLELVRQQIVHGTDMSAIGERIHQLIKCASWPISAMEERYDLPNTITGSPTLAQLVEILGSFAPWSCVPRSEMPDQEAIFSRAKAVLELDKGDAVSTNPQYLQLLERLKRLPTELSQALGRPDRVQEVLATLAAISSLVVCCEVSFASDSKEAAWHGMVGWLGMISPHFEDMLAEEHPAALALTQYWSELVYRAEGSGFWFLSCLGYLVHYRVYYQWPENEGRDVDLGKAFT